MLNASSAAGGNEGEYYAGKAGINRALLQELGLPAPSFFESTEPEQTLIAFSDVWGKIDYDPSFAKRTHTAERRTRDSERPRL